MKIVPATKSDAQIVAEIVSLSNYDVAVKFGINKENNPKHPSFYDEKWALTDMQRGEEYFICEKGNEKIACVAFEESSSGAAYLNRLSVLPNYRRQGVGESLIRYIVDVCKTKNIKKISIGIIANHLELKSWYLKQGFKEKGLKEFPHLPFNVQFMMYEISD